MCVRPVHDFCPARHRHREPPRLRSAWVARPRRPRHGWQGHAFSRRLARQQEGMHWASRFLVPCSMKDVKERESASRGEEKRREFASAPETFARSSFPPLGGRLRLRLGHHGGALGALLLCSWQGLEPTGRRGEGPVRRAATASSRKKLKRCGPDFVV